MAFPVYGTSTLEETFQSPQSVNDPGLIGTALVARLGRKDVQAHLVLAARDGLIDTELDPRTRFLSWQAVLTAAA
jgi:hypothetical protein